jgi:signal recognition particle subunit SRP54
VFDQLSDRLNAIFSRLTGRGRLSESDVNEVMREVRIALLEADVSLSAAKEFVGAIKEKAVGADVMASLSPAQTIVKIVHDELVELLGGAQARLQFSDAPPSVIMLVGLQGSGKTTHAGKLALRLKEQGRRTWWTWCSFTTPPRCAHRGSQVLQRGTACLIKRRRRPPGFAR